MRIIGFGSRPAAPKLSVETGSSRKAAMEQETSKPVALKETLLPKQEQRGPSSSGTPPRKIPGSPDRVRGSGSSSIGSSSTGFMKSTAASESRDLSSPTRTVSEDSTTSTEREIALEKLRASLGRFVRSGNRKMLMKALKECRALRAVPIDDIDANILYPSTVDEMTHMEKEQISLPVALNGMLLGSDGRPSKFTHLLRLLCNRLSRAEIEMTSDELYEAVLVRLVTEGSEQITATTLQACIETSELSVRVLARNSAIKPKPTQPRQPSKLTLYTADGAAHCVVEHVHTVGLYRKSDTGRPWVAFSALVRERINLSTGAGVKHITVQVPNDKLYG